MDIPSVPNVAIGLFFIYSLLSLLVSELQELLSTYIWDGRARNLYRSILTLVGDSVTQSLYIHPLIQSISQEESQQLFAGISYIPNDIFAVALIEIILDQAGEPDDPDKLDYQRFIAFLDTEAVRGSFTAEQMKLFKILAFQAMNQNRSEVSYSQALQTEIMIWFDRAMQQASSLYRRRVRWRMIALGFLVAVVVNADTFNIANRLAEETLLQEQLLQFIEDSSSTYLADNLSDATVDLTTLFADISMLPIGWSSENLIGQFGDVEHSINRFRLLQVLLGWVLTAIATSMGASFWFDLLNRLVNARSARKPTNPEPNRAM
ncbi:MAG: hypothetical protein ACFBSC_19555 [Microcoleaceae cyanobacterium]